ncbi:MAG: hypothetical protein EBR30_26380 [Cytophagia bacterium]|nr:hypothetical protein [Cytophagia bacterium]
MKSRCKTCGKNCEGEYCFVHKPRKKLSSKLDKKLDKSEMQEFFLRIWKKKLHYSQVSMDYLGSEPLTIFFHHILPKEKYPQAMYDEENIVLLTLEEHDNVERDMYKYETINKLREKLLEKYEN